MFAFSEAKIRRTIRSRKEQSLRFFLGDIQKAKEEKVAPALAKEPVEVAKAEAAKPPLPKEPAPSPSTPVKEESQVKAEAPKPIVEEALAEKGRVAETQQKGREYDRRSWPNIAGRGFL